ncbi:LysR family transcriptional regulator ArgP [Seleniivibrio woodruffii]|uniref:LysR family transcriptional regulator ArgP n=1 Tax=Seleniivibrio woodruffii TaxID=1078050 RepID=UPI002409F1FD|nr:LysR family transcriptional regulator ArgP [Seleniivibrio woodruffii]
MYDYKLLEAFCAVVECGGFEKAAEKLFITQSAVSQRVRLLEDAAKSVLLVRSNPPVPTDTGRAFIAHFNKVRMLESELEKTLSHDEDCGYTSISVGLNADTLATWFFDAIEETVKRENILLKLRVDDQEVTHGMLKNGDVSGCISTRSTPMQGCSVHYLGKTTYRMYVSPHKKDEWFPEGFTIEALKSVPVIIYNERDTLHTQMFRNALGTEEVQYPSLFIPSVEKYLDAVMRGMGIGMMPDPQCWPFLQKGIIADAAAPFTVEAHLYWHRWNIHSKPLDALTKSLIRYCKDM